VRERCSISLVDHIASAKGAPAIDSESPFAFSAGNQTNAAPLVSELRAQSTEGSDEGGPDPDPIQEAALSAPMDSMFQQSFLGRRTEKSVGSASQPSLSPTQQISNQDSQYRPQSVTNMPSIDPVDLGICSPDEGMRLFAE
jgi:hypothetical protein